MPQYQIPIHLVLQALELRAGKVYWKERPREDFARESSWKRHNTLFVGEEFGSLAHSVYRAGTIRVNGRNRRLLYHVAVWVLAHGKYPEGIIDHEDGNPLNNDVSNLRDIPRKLNARNARKRSDNNSGINGVYWHSRDHKWVATGVTMNNGKSRSLYLGYFDKLEAAAEARRAWELSEDGFTDRHGK